MARGGMRKAPTHLYHVTILGTETAQVRQDNVIGRDPGRQVATGMRETRHAAAVTGLIMAATPQTGDGMTAAVVGVMITASGAQPAAGDAARARHDGITKEGLRRSGSITTPIFHQAISRVSSAADFNFIQLAADEILVLSRTLFVGGVT